LKPTGEDRDTGPIPTGIVLDTADGTADNRPVTTTGRRERANMGQNLKEPDQIPARPARIMFIALVLLVLFAPLAGTMRLPVLNMLLTLVIIAAINLAAANRRTLVIGLVLGAPALAFAWLGRVGAQNAVIVVRYVVFDLLMLLVFVMMLRAVLRSRRVTRETVLLGLSCYLLIGLLWVAAYATLEFVQPGSFDLPDSSSITNVFGQVSYFSFVTLTTVGYGDILPVTPLARGLANLEAVAGVLFVAVFISRLIAMYETEQR
jgi:hypothetical protein